MSSLVHRAAAAALGAGATGMSRAAERAGDAARVLRFLRGRLEFRPRPDDIFIATYPRSGTTLMQFLLYQLTSDGSMAFEHIDDVAPWWERGLALGRFRARALDALPAPRVFKSHLPRRWLPRGARYIYVERDGLDVALSYYHLYRSYLSFSGTFAQFFERFLAGDLQYGSYFKHLAGWRRFANDPSVLWLRFESLTGDMPAAVDRITEFLRLDVDAATRQRTLERCQFSFMKAHEVKFDHATDILRARGSGPGTFLRGGRVGDGAHRDDLGARQRARYDAVGERRWPRPDIELDLARFLR